MKPIHSCSCCLISNFFSSQLNQKLIITRSTRVLKSIISPFDSIIRAVQCTLFHGNCFNTMLVCTSKAVTYSVVQPLDEFLQTVVEPDCGNFVQTIINHSQLIEFVIDYLHQFWKEHTSEQATNKKIKKTIEWTSMQSKRWNYSECVGVECQAESWWLWCDHSRIYRSRWIAKSKN
jgi:hypothetical protein